MCVCVCVCVYTIQGTVSFPSVGVVGVLSYSLRT